MMSTENNSTLINQQKKKEDFMRVCVTGAGGFAASYLIELLIQEGYEVHGIVSPRNDRSNLLAVEDQMAIYTADLQNQERVFALIDAIRPEGLFHLASYAVPSQSFHLVREVLSVNTSISVNLFESLRLLKISPRVLCVSSVDVYRSGLHRPLSEEDEIGPINPYGISKYTQELLCTYYEQVYNLPVIRVRAFAFTGPRQKPVFAVPSFCQQIAVIEADVHHQPVIEVGNIDVIRDYTDVRDIARGLLYTFQYGKNGEVYNLCSGIEVTVRDILKTLLSYTEKSIQIKVNRAYFRPFDAGYVVGDNGRAKRQLAWLPQIQLSTTLRDMLSYWRDHTLQLYGKEEDECQNGLS